MIERIKYLSELPRANNIVSESPIMGENNDMIQTNWKKGITNIHFDEYMNVMKGDARTIMTIVTGNMTIQLIITNLRTFSNSLCLSLCILENNGKATDVYIPLKESLNIAAVVKPLLYRAKSFDE